MFLVLHREEGQGLAEYALILSIIAIMAVVALVWVSGNITQLISVVGHGI